MIDHDADSLADLAENVARAAGELAQSMAVEARRAPSTKSTDTDLVTMADRAAEELIATELLASRPDDGIQGEEGTLRPRRSAVDWHIDPIDGTTNYVYGIPAYSISIAAAVDDEVVAGVVYDPTADELYRATVGHGSSCNGARLACRSAADLATALIGTGFGYRPERRRDQGRVLGQLLPAIRDIRRFGSAALDLCAVAAGRLDGYYERGLNRWDMAAGVLIAAEAGATVGNLRGGEPDEGFVLAAAPSLFVPLRQRLVDLSADGPEEL